VFTARYGLGPYIKQTRFVFKRLNLNIVNDTLYFFTNNLKISRKKLCLKVREESRPRVFENGVLRGHIWA